VVLEFGVGDITPNSELQTTALESPPTAAAAYRTILFRSTTVGV